MQNLLDLLDSATQIATSKMSGERWLDLKYASIVLISRLR